MLALNSKTSLKARDFPPSVAIYLRLIDRRHFMLSRHQILSTHRESPIGNRKLIISPFCRYRKLSIVQCEEFLIRSQNILLHENFMLMPISIKKLPLLMMLQCRSTGCLSCFFFGRLNVSSLNWKSEIFEN